MKWLDKQSTDRVDKKGCSFKHYQEYWAKVLGHSKSKKSLSAYTKNVNKKGSR